MFRKFWSDLLAKNDRISEIVLSNFQSIILGDINSPAIFKYSGTKVISRSGAVSGQNK